MKTLVLYVFHKYNQLVKHFIEDCMFYHENIDFIIISNDKTNEGLFRVPYYASVLYRDNVGYDFGGWSEALFTNNLYKKYDNFIFVNSSAFCPVITSFYNYKWRDRKTMWTSIYLDGLKDNIKLFGSTINTLKDPLNRAHVQSYIFSMDKSALDYLTDCEIFSMKNPESCQHNEANKEILMSRKIIQNNWNIGSLLTYYKDIDFTFSNKSPHHYKLVFLDDIMCNEYRNVLWKDSELIFIKGNRM